MKDYMIFILNTRTFTTEYRPIRANSIDEIRSLLGDDENLVRVWEITKKEIMI
jgi:hypothetical protein